MYVSLCINTWYIPDTYMKIYVDYKCLFTMRQNNMRRLTSTFDLDKPVEPKVATRSTTKFNKPRQILLNVLWTQQLKQG